MISPDRSSLLLNLILVLPLLLFLPGYALTRTFLKIPVSVGLLEKFFLRIFLSCGVTSYVGLGITLFSEFSGQILVCGVVVFSFLLFLAKRFRLSQGLGPIEISWNDFFIVLMVGLAVILFFWPSEEIGSLFSQGIQLGREGTLFQGKGLLFFMKGEVPGSIWIAAFDVFFGVHLALFVSPLFGVLSVLALFFCVIKRFDAMAAVSAGLFLATSLTQIYFARCPQSLMLAQFFVLASFYCYQLYEEEKEIGFLGGALLLFVLAVFARWEMYPVLLFMVAAYFVNRILSQRKLNISMILRCVSCIFVVAGWVWVLKEFPQISSVFPCSFLVFSFGGVLFFLWRNFKIEDGSLLALFILSPFLAFKGAPKESINLISLSGWIPLLIPALSLWSGYALSIFSCTGKIAQGFSIFALVLTVFFPLYTHWDFLGSREDQGLIKFYQNLRGFFLPNDLVFSSQSDLASLFQQLFGLKVYSLPPEGLDFQFQKEIRLWLKDGGKAYVMSENGEPKMDGFIIKLQSVEKLETQGMDVSSLLPERKILKEKTVKIYEAE
ncbi:MAG: glycosyltransferase family 39 protein [Chlamydiae bacterium]|nr:glycosyltransferase family 39 protein [Chlamydiota bacterium]MBI3277347.1 glycosyltransferase family 39 protein [Chlamydiota bacterium]